MDLLFTVNSNICYLNFCLSIQRKQSQQFKVPHIYINISWVSKCKGDQIHCCCAGFPFMWGFPSKPIFVQQVKQSAETLEEASGSGKVKPSWSEHPCSSGTADVQVPPVNPCDGSPGACQTLAEPLGALGAGRLCTHTPDPAGWDSPAQSRAQGRSATAQLLLRKA